MWLCHFLIAESKIAITVRVHKINYVAQGFKLVHYMNADFFLRLRQILDMFISIPTLYSGEKLLWLSDRGDGLRDEVYTANLREYRG